MAYYIVNAGSLSFANGELMSAYTGRSIDKLIMDRGRPFELFGVMLFKLSDLERNEIMVTYDLVTIQNIDQSVSILEESLEPPKDSKVIKAQARDKYYYGGLTFVPFKDLKVSSKYNFKKYFPAVKVCGALFVALNAKFKDDRPSFYVRPSKASK